MFTFHTADGGTVRLGPDASHLFALAEGTPVPRPFHLRWLLPTVCRNHWWRWWTVWLSSWVIIAGAVLWWRYTAGDNWPTIAAAIALLLALPGVLGPSITIPVGVDLPAMAMSLTAVALLENRYWWAAIPVTLIAASIKESAPIWTALWAWNPIALVGLIAPTIRALLTEQGRSPFGSMFQEIADHPIRTAWERHRGQWRNATLMVAPWGVTLAALYQPSWQTIVVLLAAHLQLLVATDQVRLVQAAAGPTMAVAAAHNIPTTWLLLAVIAHTFWWRPPQRG